MSKIFKVEFEVADNTPETAFGTALVKAVHDLDTDSLRWLERKVGNIVMLPYQEPSREWAVQYCTEHSNEVEEFGFFGRESEAVDACREQFPGCPIVGTYVKEF